MEEWYQSNKVSFQRNRGCMVNYRNVSYALGVLVLVEAGFSHFVQVFPSTIRKKTIFIFRNAAY